VHGVPICRVADRDPTGDLGDPTGDLGDPAGDRGDPAGDHGDPAGDHEDPTGDHGDPRATNEGSAHGNSRGRTTSRVRRRAHPGVGESLRGSVHNALADVHSDDMRNAL
jgi:hypothetical protein